MARQSVYDILLLKMKLSEELMWRGFVNQTTLKELTDLDNNKKTFYHGFDASADSQTIGNLAAMMFDKVFLRHGYKGILLAGGATSLIGDPGGKDKERVLQDEATIAKNVANAGNELSNVLRGHEFTLVNNLDWTRDMKVLPFLRDIGKHFSMTPLVQRDYISSRLGDSGTGISYTEFSYTILQGYDYLHLFEKYGVTLQLGGSDQWGNCLSGVELVRKVHGKRVDVITLNLVINKATGIKFGKSEEGAVWLDPVKTTPNDFYQFWLNADDNGVEEYLKIYTELDKKEVDEIMNEFKKDKSTRLAQRKLAGEVTKLVHGDDAAKAAQEAAQSLSGTQGASSNSKAIHSEEISGGASLVDTLVSTGLASSKTEARQLIGAGGIYVNGEKTSKESLDDADFEDGLLKLRRGKTLKNTVILRQKK